MDEQPDLLDIPTYYEKDGGAFWLAVQDCTVIGTLALMNKGNGNGVLKKGFVNKSFRKRGILTELYKVLLDYAEKNNMKKKISMGSPSFQKILRQKSCQKYFWHCRGLFGNFI